MIARSVTLAFVAAVCLPAGAGAAGKVYGKGVALKAATPVVALLEGPADYVGKTVRVDGVVKGVCQMRGCWIEVADEKSGKSIRLKVEDGVIVFPKESAGHKVSAEGVFEKVASEPGQSADHASHAGAAAGHECPMEAANASGNTVYQIRGTGALID
jgi:hypothetical protein